MFPTQVPGEPAYPGSNWGGCMAVGPTGCAIVAWGAKRAPRYTKDGYRTWATLPFPGLPGDGSENGIGDWSNGYFSKKNICYDKTGGAYYLYDYGPRSDGSKAGIWKSVDKGDSWSQVFAGTLPLGVYHCRLRPVPGHAGELFFVAGVGQNTPIVKLIDHMNGKMTVSKVPNTAFVTDIAFGRPLPGSQYPVVLAFGQIDGEWGYHVSYDYCAKWTHLGYIDGWMDWPKVLQGDPDNLGVFYAGMAASGVRRIAYQSP